MQKNKTTILYFIASTAFSISAIIDFSNSDSSMGTMHSTALTNVIYKIKSFKWL